MLETQAETNAVDTGFYQKQVGEQTGSGTRQVAAGDIVVIANIAYPGPKGADIGCQRPKAPIYL